MRNWKIILENGLKILKHYIKKEPIAHSFITHHNYHIFVNQHSKTQLNIQKLQQKLSQTSIEAEYSIDFSHVHLFLLFSHRYDNNLRCLPLLESVRARTPSVLHVISQQFNIYHAKLVVFWRTPSFPQF